MRVWTSESFVMNGDNMKIKTIIICLFVFIIFSGCKPDNLEIEIYTSDIIDAVSDGEVGEVPLKATFKIMGDGNGVIDL